MRSIVLLAVGLLFHYVGVAQNITRVEYFIDTDPGFGNGTSVAITPAVTINNLTFNVPLNSLTPGFHTLYVRAKNANQKWGITHNTVLYKLAGTVAEPLPNITRLEYFVDTDPGIGLGTNVPITANTVFNNLVFNVPVNALSDGFHTLYVRTRNARGNWSITHNTMFYKVAALVSAPLRNITRVEYFVNTDPGFGNGTALPITPGTSLNNLNFVLNVTSLTEGQHNLFIRARDANGRWSVVAVRSFSKCNHPGTTVNAAAAVTNTGFTASWADVPGSVSYQLDVSTDNFVTFVSGYNARAITAPALSFAVTGLSQATTYQYRVRAVASCTSVESNVGSLTTLATPPSSQPTNLLFSSVTSNSFTAFFTAPSTPPTGYLVVRKIGSASAFVPTNNTTYTVGQNTGDGVIVSVGTNTILNETGLTPDTQYFYRVFAFNTFNGQTSYLTTSPLQNNVRTVALEPTAQPTNLQFTSVTDVSFTLSYSAAAGNPTGYLVLRRTGSAPTSVPVDGITYTTTVGTDAVVNNGAATSFSQTGLTQNTNYFYTVYAYNGSGTAINYLTTSPLQGNQITPITPPSSSPTNLVFSNVTPNSMTVSYAAATGSPSGYLVVRKIGSSSSFVPQTNVAYTAGQVVTDGVIAYVGSGLSFNESGLTPSTSYFYDVFAYNQAGALIGYRTTAPLEGSQTTFTAEPTAQASSLVFSSITSSSLTVGYTAASPIPTNYLVLRKAGSAPTSLPVDGTAYALGQSLGDGTVAYLGNATSFSDNGLSSGIIYFYQVFSVNGSGASSNYLTTVNSSNSGSKITVPGKPVLNTPNTAIGQNQFTFSWAAVTGASSYRADVSKDNFNTYVAGFNNTTVSSTSITVTGLESGTPYKYRVRAVNESGTSVNSDEGQQFTKPATPGAPFVSNITQSGFLLTWNAISGAVGYELDISENDFSTNVTGYDKLVVNTNTITVTGLNAGKNYRARIRSTNSGGISPSGPITELQLVPSTPIAQDATNTTSTSFKAKWSTAEGATEYRLDVSLASNNFSPSLPNYTNIAIVGNVEEIISGLLPATAYRYRVRAINGSGSSPSSNVINVSTLEPGTGSTLQLSTISYKSSIGSVSEKASIEILSGTGPFTVNFFHRKITQKDFAKINPVAVSGTQYEATISPNMADEIGVEFYFSVTDGSGANRETAQVRSYVKIPDNGTRIPFTRFGGTLNSYELFSIPYKLDDNLIASIFEEMGEYKKSEWRLVRFQGGKNVDFGSGINRIELGKGYWFNQKNKIEIFFSGGTVNQVNEQEPATIDLEKGWNQIGNPLPFNLKWSEVLSENNNPSGVGELSVYNATTAQLNNSNNLNTWSGGFVFSDSQIKINVPVSLRGTIGGRNNGSSQEVRILPGVRNENDWFLPFRISQGNLETNAGVGMHIDAIDGKDWYDNLLPPRWGPILEFYSEHLEFMEPKFNRDIVYPKHTQIWKFEFETTENVETLISWDPEYLSDLNSELLLIHEKNGTVINLKELKNYSFIPADKEVFKVVFAKNIGDISFSIPQVGAPYPNPMRNSTTLPFIVNQENSIVEITIHDLFGKEIFDKVISNMSKGVHSFTWQGKNKFDEEIGNSLYLISLKINNKTFTKRIIKL